MFNGNDGSIKTSAMRLFKLNYVLLIKILVHYVELNVSVLHSVAMLIEYGFLIIFFMENFTSIMFAFRKMISQTYFIIEEHFRSDGLAGYLHVLCQLERISCKVRK